MGITAMGDVINIMKQAKKTYSLVRNHVVEEPCGWSR